MQLDRRHMLIASAGLALGASPAFAQATADEMTIGAASARVHLVEYASATCPHCAEFHHDNWRLIKSYVDNGRIRYTVREMVTPPPAVALAMFQLSRCGGASADEYFRRLAILFERQRAILGTGSMAGVRDALLAAGGEWGLSQEQVLASLNDPAGAERINRSINEAMGRGVNSTPTFFLNNALVDHHGLHTPEEVARVLDAALG